MGAHGWNGSLCWPRKQRMKSQWPLRPWRYCPSHILLSHWHLPSRGYRTPDSRPQATWPQDPSCRLKINHPLRDFPLVEYKKDPIRKKGHWFFSRASHPLIFPLRNSFSCLTAQLILFVSALTLQSWCMIFLYVVEFGLLIFCWEFLQLYSSRYCPSFSFLVVSLSGW